jgi:hypothetical protein
MRACAAAVLILRDARTPAPICGRACAFALLRMRTAIACKSYSLFKQPISFPRRVLRPGFAFLASLIPDEGVAERRESYGCSDTRGPALSGQARHLARRLASPYGGRPPPGARTVAILGAGAALALTGIAAGSVIANSHVRVVVPGGGPLPPGATVASHRRGTPRLAPPSGCLRTTPLEEQGWEDSYYTSQNAVNRKLRYVVTRISPRGSWKPAGQV